MHEGGFHRLGTVIDVYLELVAAGAAGGRLVMGNALEIARQVTGLVRLHGVLVEQGKKLERLEGRLLFHPGAQVLVGRHLVHGKAQHLAQFPFLPGPQFGMVGAVEPEAALIHRAIGPAGQPGKGHQTDAALDRDRQRFVEATFEIEGHESGGHALACCFH